MEYSEYTSMMKKELASDANSFELVVKKYEDKLLNELVVDREKLLFNLYYNAANKYRIVGNPQQAYEYLKLALNYLSFFEGEELDSNCYKIYNLYGILFVGFGKIDDALVEFNKSMHFAEKLNDEVGVAGLLNNIGTIYNELKEFEKANEYYFKAVSLNSKIGKLDNLGRNYCNIGASYVDRKDYKSAANSFKKAIEVHSQICDEASLIIDYANLAIVFFDDNNLNEVLPYLNKSEELISKHGNNEIKALNFITFGRYYLKLSDQLKAVDSFQKAMELSAEIENPRWETDAAENLLHIYVKNKKWEEAFNLSVRLNSLKEKLRYDEFKEKLQLEEAKQKLIAEEASRIASDKILYKVLPEEIALKIKSGASEIMEEFESGTVLFADISGFTEWSSNLSTSELAFHLNNIFTGFDQLCEEFEVEKIKTIGDAYMCASGLPLRIKNHEMKMAHFALKAMSFFNDYAKDLPVSLRIGIHTGSVVAGVLGKNKYSYDLWGDTVNTASRMESQGEAGRIHVTMDFYNKLKDNFRFFSRGEIYIKGKGNMKTYFLDSNL